jgi:hypothetical protein
MANTSTIPNDLIESLKAKKEENENSERLIKINSAIANEQRDLTEIQITQLVALRNTLTSDSLTTLEEKREANDVAEETLRLLREISDNTEEDKFNIKAKGGIVSKILALTQGLLVGFTVGLFQGIIASFKSFMKFPTFKKIFAPITTRLAKFTKPVIALFKYFGNVFKAIADIYKKTGSGQFLKGDTRKIFNQKAIKGLQRIFTAVKSLVGFIKTMVGFVTSGAAKIKTFGSMLKGGVVKLVTPIMTWFKDLKGVFLEFKTFFSSASAKPSMLSRILAPVQNVLGMAQKFKGIFIKLGRLFGKLFLPFTIVLSLFDGIMAGLKEFKTSEYDNIFMKLLDTALAGIGGFLGSFIGGIVDLVKMGLSWVASKLGFDGLSEWLDSFSIEDMVKTGLANLLDMLDMLFTDLIPAIFAGVKAKLTGGSFNEAFNDRLYGTEGAEGGEKADSRFFALKDEQRDIKTKIAEEQKELDSGDSKGGVYGFQYDRAERIAELKAEKALLDKQIATRGELLKQGAVLKMANTTGATMEAMQDDNLDAKSAPTAVAPVFAPTDASTNTTNSNTTITNQMMHVDRTMNLATAQ